MKILLLSDESINVNKSGFAQTVYNVICFMQPENLLFVTSVRAYKKSMPSEPFTCRTITYNFEIIPSLPNRIGNILNKLINYLNYSINYHFRSFKRTKKIIREFNPDVVITAPNESEGLFMHYKLKPAFQHKKVFPYFMDDWLRESRARWLGNNIHSLAKQFLNENDRWMMIGKNLSDILSERYAVKPKCILEIHNPVDISGITEPSFQVNKAETVFAYAGSLWQMHFDAFLVFANAINMLQKKRKIKLIVYTSSGHWTWRRKELEHLRVEYGGNIAYNEIHKTLQSADYLLVTSSFIKRFYTHSKGSLQTKLTDYLKAGRLIISCGPTYSANHEFLKKYDCGICIETTDVKRVADELDKILNNTVSNERYIQNGFDLLKDKFSFEKVHQRLKDFLTSKKRKDFQNT